METRDGEGEKTERRGSDGRVKKMRVPFDSKQADTEDTNEKKKTERETRREKKNGLEITMRKNKSG
jgi:hypothetical protein